tara:strand:+ start:1452 stop:2093 length:642 start_codon:yes stop_codon:yes gene_type:complete
MSNIFVIDYETNGLNPYYNEITEVAIKKVDNDNYYQTLVKPTDISPIHGYVSPRIVKITGITNEMINESGIDKNISTYNTIQYISNNVPNDNSPIYLLAHNGNGFDFIFLRRYIHEYNLVNEVEIDNSILTRIMFIDTLLVAKTYLRNEYVNQPGLCKKYNIKNEAEHRALGDVQALEKLYKEMCRQKSMISKKSDETYYFDNPNIVLQELFP